MVSFSIGFGERWAMVSVGIAVGPMPGSDDESARGAAILIRPRGAGPEKEFRRPFDGAIQQRGATTPGLWFIDTPCRFL